jgi:undecaprenyl diphosphate synthase
LQSTLPLRQPLHVAIIMDGNGRWGVRRGLSRAEGHLAGVEAVRRTVEAAPELGVTTLTLYAFSSDNWRRPPAEVDCLMDLFRRYLAADGQRLVDSGARLSMLGRRDRLPEDLAGAIASLEAASADGAQLNLRIALDYSSRAAIVRAAAAMSADGDIDDFDRLVTGGAEPVDLVIRTGGEQRLSDFLLWECAYAELWFTERTWPEFEAADLAAAIGDFRKRHRTFGAIPEPKSVSSRKLAPASYPGPTLTAAAE